MPRCLILFDNAIKSPVTKRSYTFNLNQFLSFVAKKPENLLDLKDSDLQILLENYLFYLKKKVSPNSIKTKLAPVALFLSMNDRTLNFKKLYKMCPETLKTSGKGAWPTQDIQKMLTFTSEKRSRAMIHFLASTGVRIGVIHELKHGHMSTMPGNCKCVKIHEDAKEEYLVFLTPEASESLEQYLDERRSDGEILNDNSPLFRTKYDIGSAKAKPMSISSCVELVKRVVTNAGLVRQKIGNRYSIQLNHGFRKRYNTILKLMPEINPSAVEKLLGHKNGLDGVYFVPTKEELFEEFKKGILGLTISDENRLRLENTKLKTDVKTTDELQTEMRDFKKTITTAAEISYIFSLQDSIQRDEAIGKLKERYNLDPNKSATLTINIDKEYLKGFPFFNEMAKELDKISA
ncbi:MAG: site-specific integrase [Candidatus Nitrosotalea sp.]|nr:site-specific integrase [Candidatus Nitrosotalea sp.]